MDLALDLVVPLLMAATFVACYFYGYYRGAAAQRDRHLAAWDALQQQLLAQSQPHGFLVELRTPEAIEAIKRQMN